MILDIDIRVSNDEGVQIHRFAKHFDSRFEGSRESINSGYEIQKSFQEFLSEYLSGSGRVIRTNLIGERAASSVRAQNPSPYYGDIEYTLKLGDSQSVSGKIPLEKLWRLNEMAQFETTRVDIPPAPPVLEHTALIPEQSVVYGPPLTIYQVDQMFQNFITSALNNYENNFYVKDPEKKRFYSMA